MDSEQMRKQMEELQAQLNEARAMLMPLTDQHQKMNALEYNISQEFQTQINELQRQKTEKLQEIREKKKRIADPLFEAQSAFNKLNDDLERTGKELELAITAEERAAAEQQKLIDQQKADEELTKKWDDLTIAAPWRELAKQHQIDGGQKIARDRYVICADPMGLGKTLTSIITCDLAERGSVDASLDNPWLGEEREQYIPERYYWTKKTESQVKLGFPDESVPSFVKNYQRVYQMNEGDQVLGLHILSYDGKNSLVSNGWAEISPAHSEKQIVNSITRPVGRKVLYLCPSSLLRNVLDEWRMWAPHRNATYIGGLTKAERNFVLSTVSAVPNFVIICNYEAWRKDHSLLDSLNGLEFDTVIIDEAHNAKDRKTSVYKGIEKLVIQPPSGKRPEYVIPMTGTPILNRPQELFSLLTMVNPEEFRHENDFLRNYCEQYETDDGQFRWKFQEGGLDRVVRRIGKHFIRRTKDQAGIKLPPKTVTIHEIPLDEETYKDQARVREQMRKFATIIIDKNKGKALSANAIIAVFTRLRQIETWPAGIIQYAKNEDENSPDFGKVLRDPETNEKIIALKIDVEESQKIDYVIRKDEHGDWDGLIPEAIEDERMVLFSQFKAPLQVIADRVNASGKRAVILDGDTPNNLRDEIRRDFDARHTPAGEPFKWDIVLCNYKVGGVGFNFTCASQLIALDEEWNPGKRDQAYDRIDRIGQLKPTTVHVVRNTPTIDDWLAKIMEQKEGVVEGFNNAIEINTSSIREALENGEI